MQKFCFYTGGASPSPTIYNYICIKHRSLNFKTNFIDKLKSLLNKALLFYIIDVRCKDDSRR